MACPAAISEISRRDVENRIAQVRERAPVMANRLYAFINCVFKQAGATMARCPSALNRVLRFCDSRRTINELRNAMSREQNA
jgi:hypothetical protein